MSFHRRTVVELFDFGCNVISAVCLFFDTYVEGMFAVCTDSRMVSILPVAGKLQILDILKQRDGIDILGEIQRLSSTILCFINKFISV